MEENDPKIKLWPILDVLGRNKNLDEFTKERLYLAIADVTTDDVRTGCNEEMKEFYKQMYIDEGDDPTEAGKTGDRIAGSRLGIILTNKGNFDSINESQKVEPVGKDRMAQYTNMVK